MTTADSARRQFLTPRVVTIFKIVFGVAVVAFGGIYIASRWDELRQRLAAAHPWWLGLAAVFAVIGLLWAMVGTRLSIEITSGQRLPVRSAARVFFVSQLGKYIPGSVWPVVAVTAMTRRFGISSVESAAAGLLSMFLSLIAGGSFGILMTLAAAHGDAGGLWWLTLLVPLAAVLLNPRLVLSLINRVLRLIKRPALPGPLSTSLWMRAVTASGLSWVFLGLQSWALCVSLGASLWGSLLAAVGGFALAFTAGTLAVPAPAGAGVREGVLGFALAGTVNNTATFSAGGVVAVVLVSRVLLAVLDFSLAGLSVILSRRIDIGPSEKSSDLPPPVSKVSPLNGDDADDGPA